MIRTQIQLPDALYRRAKELAEQREISLAELVRRGLEYLTSVSPEVGRQATAWELPQPAHLGGGDPFADPAWREQLHVDADRAAADAAGDYRTAEDKP